jgi:hypothetical protein
MTAAYGTGFEIIKPTTALGAVSGVNIPLVTPQNAQFCNQLAAYITYVASATVGNRRLSVQIKDAAGNIMLQVANALTLQAASTTWFYTLGPGMPAADLSAALGMALAWPLRFVIQPGSSLQILDLANISTADTVAANITVALS